MKSGDHLIACGAAGHGTAYRSPTPRTDGTSLPTLLALLVSSAALPLLLLLAYHFAREAQVGRKTGNEWVRTLAAITATDAAAAMGEAERLGRSLAERPLVRSLDPARCDPLIAEQLKLNRHFANIATVDAHGNSMCSPLQGSDAPVVGIGQPDWLANIKTGNRFTIGSPQRGVHSGRWIAVAAYPIRDAQGAVAGAVEIVILLGAFRPVVSAALPPGGVAGIIDSGGMVIARSEQAEQMIGRKIEDNALSRMILEGRADLAVMRGVDGIERVWAARPIPNTSWFAAVGIPAELTSAGVWAVTWRNLFIGLLIAGIAAYAVRAIHRRIAGPLLELDRTARSIAAHPEGRPPAREEGPREIRTLAASFNRMLASLAAARDLQRAGEERLRQATDAARLGLFDSDFETHTATWDARTRQIWELAPDEPVWPDTFMSGVHPEDRAALQKMIDAATAPGSDGLMRAKFRVIGRSSGIIRHVDAAGRVHFKDGRPALAIGVVRDVSNEEALQAELRRRRLETERLVKQQVAAHTAAAIAHELNQPLHAVSMYSQAALDMLGSGDHAPDKLRRALELAAQQARRAGDSLHELIDYLHQGEPVSAPFDINQAIRDAVDANREEGHGDHRCELHLEDGLRQVMGNRLQIVKVLHNLINNGVEAMHAAGGAAGEPLISVRTAAAGDMAEVRVRDRGPGISETLASRLFEPFFTTKPGGMGLGLPISRAVVRAHGGELWCEPPGEAPGAEFHFTLPFAP